MPKGQVIWQERQAARRERARWGVMRHREESSRRLAGEKIAVTLSDFLTLFLRRLDALPSLGAKHPLEPAPAARPSGWMALLLAILAIACACAMAPTQQAWAYFDRGTVKVALGSQSLDLQVGQTGSVSLAFTPSSDEQTPGCGMPSCPQKCASTCLDANGQCQCGGKELTTYFPSAKASSDSAGVARAFCSGNSLYIIGISAGQATVSVTASLRQFHDSTVQLHVTVTGEGTATSTTVSGWEASLPAASAADTSDRDDLVNKTIMNRPIRYVRIGSSADTVAQMRDFVGVDGDLTFWTGENYYAPTYSMTFKASLKGDVPASFDPSCAVSQEASGELTQPLYGKTGFLVLDFAQRGTWPASANIYVATQGLFADGADVALFSYDPSTKSLVKEDASVSVEGGYVVFPATEGKLYAVAPADFQANAATSSAGNSSAQSTGSAETVGAAPIIIVVAAVCVVAIAIIIVRRNKATKE